jgi:hypothetical protein
MAEMASQSRVFRSLPLALIVAVSAVAAGCSSGAAAGLATTAIVHLPSGFHVSRPRDDRLSDRAPARAKPVATEMAILRLESAPRRAAASIEAAAVSSAAGGFVCQIDMGTAPLD